MPTAETEEQVKREWNELIAPTLPSLDQKLSQNLLFEALWQRVLDESSRQLLVRATILRRPANWELMQVLAAVEDEDTADAAIRKLRKASLLIELEIRLNDQQTERRFEIHPNVARLAEQNSQEFEALKQQGHKLAGDFLEQHAVTSRTWDDDIEAAHHLDQIGENDRAFDLLMPLVQWLFGRGGILAGQSFLNQLNQPDTLNLQNKGRFLGLQGEANIGLGDLQQALTRLKQSVEVFTEQAAQDPSNAGWQADLAWSYGEVAALISATGGDSIRIESLLKQGLSILYRLRDESRLTHAQMGWITSLEEQLVKPQVEHEQRSFFSRLAGGLRRFLPGRF